MLKSDVSSRLDMYPLEPDILWGLMNRHKLVLRNSATLMDTSDIYLPTSKYSYYRYFLKLGIEAKYWVAVMVTNDIGSLTEMTDNRKPLWMPDLRLVEQIYTSVE